LHPTQRESSHAPGPSHPSGIVRRWWVNLRTLKGRSVGVDQRRSSSCLCTIMITAAFVQIHQIPGQLSLLTFPTTVNLLLLIFADKSTRWVLSYFQTSLLSKFQLESDVYSNWTLSTKSASLGDNRHGPGGISSGNIAGRYLIDFVNFKDNGRNQYQTLSHRFNKRSNKNYKLPNYQWLIVNTASAVTTPCHHNHIIDWRSRPPTKISVLDLSV